MLSTCKEVTKKLLKLHKFKTSPVQRHLWAKLNPVSEASLNQLVRWMALAVAYLPCSVGFRGLDLQRGHQETSSPGAGGERGASLGGAEEAGVPAAVPGPGTIPPDGSAVVTARV